MENTKKIAKSEDMYDDLRRLKALKQSIKDERGELQKEREEIDALKDSVSYLRDLFEKKVGGGIRGGGGVGGIGQ